MQILSSYIQLVVICNSTAHISARIFLLFFKVKNLHGWKFSFVTFSLFQKSWVYLIFSDPLTNSLTFPDFPNRVETLPLLVRIPTYFLGTTRNLICLRKNVICHFISTPTLLSSMSWKFLWKSFASFSFHNMQIDSFSNATRKCAKQPVYQKQPSRGVFRKMCSKNRHAANFIHNRRTPIWWSAMY